MDQFGLCLWNTPDGYENKKKGEFWFAKKLDRISPERLAINFLRLSDIAPRCCQCKWELTCRWNLFLWRSRKWRAARTTADAPRLRPRRWTRRDSCWPPPPPLNTTAIASANYPASIPTLKPGLKLSSRLQVLVVWLKTFLWRQRLNSLLLKFNLSQPRDRQADWRRQQTTWWSRSTQSINFERFLRVRRGCRCTYSYALWKLEQFSPRSSVR